MNPSSLSKATTGLSTKVPDTQLETYNQSLREVSRLLLALTAIALYGDSNGIATITSAGSFFVLREGTWFSTKNLKWKSLSVISFFFSVVAWSLHGTAATIGTENDVSNFFHLFFKSFMKFFQIFWGTILLVVLVAAYISKANETNRIISKLEPAKVM